MVEQNEVKCLICGSANVVIRDVEKEIIVCYDCKLITRPLRLEGEIANCISGSPNKE